MVKIKGKFQTQVTEIDDPEVLRFCASGPEVWHSRYEKLRLFDIYLTKCKVPDKDLFNDRELYRRRLRTASIWVSRLGVFTVLGGFYAYFSSWFGYRKPVVWCLVPVTVILFSYYHYRYDQLEHYQVMEKHEPQMKKWLCSHVPKPQNQ